MSIEKFTSPENKIFAPVKIDFTRINNDINGNPRYVCHFLNLLRSDETGYQTALNNSRQFGGKKYHTKSYGGGIVFQSYNIDDLGKKILSFTQN